MGFYQLKSYMTAKETFNRLKKTLTEYMKLFICYDFDMQEITRLQHSF